MSTTPKPCSVETPSTAPTKTSTTTSTTPSGGAEPAEPTSEGENSLEAPCLFEAFVRHLADDGLSDDCQQLDTLIRYGKTQGVIDHLDAYVRACARDCVRQMDEKRKSAKAPIQIRKPPTKPLADRRYDLLVDALSYRLGSSRKAKRFKARLKELLDGKGSKD